MWHALVTCLRLTSIFIKNVNKLYEARVRTADFGLFRVERTHTCIQGMSCVWTALGVVSFFVFGRHQWGLHHNAAVCVARPWR